MAYKVLDPRSLKFHPVYSAMFPNDPVKQSAMTLAMRETGYARFPPIMIRGGTNDVIDGNTRLRSALDAGLDLVEVKIDDYETDDDAELQAITYQVDRRNLSTADLMKLVPIVDRIKARGGDRKSDGSKTSRDVFDPKPPSSFETAKTLGIGQATVERVRSVTATGTPVEIKEAVKSGVMPLKEGAKRAAQHRRENPKPGNSARCRKSPKPQTKPVSRATIKAAFAAPRDTKTDADEEWLGSIPLRQSVGMVIDDDARLWREFSADFARIKARIAEMMGPKSDSYMGPLSLALSRLTSIGPPSTWVVCPKCKNVESARVACTRCRRRGFSIPGLD